MREGNVLVTKNAVPKNAEQGQIGIAIQSQQFVLIRKKNGTAAKKHWIPVETWLMVVNCSDLQKLKEILPQNGLGDPATMINKSTEIFESLV